MDAHPVVYKECYPAIFFFIVTLGEQQARALDYTEVLKCFLPGPESSHLQEK